MIQNLAKVVRSRAVSMTGMRRSTIRIVRNIKKFVCYLLRKIVRITPTTLNGTIISIMRIVRRVVAP